MNNYHPTKESLGFNLNQLPTFLLVGANKAGTTSIHDYCSQHPSITMSSLKEPMFFTAPRNYRPQSENFSPLANPKVLSSIEEYQALFAGGESSIARGESSTSYLANPDIAIPRIQSIRSDMKIIACLREPTERAFSNYIMYYAEGLEQRSFEEAVIDELSGRLDGIPQGRQYLKLGLYAEAISKYIQAFSNDKVLILFFDNLKASPLEFMRKVFIFLDVDSDFIPNMNFRLNTSSDRLKCTNSIPEISEKARELCSQFFAKDIQELKKILPFSEIQWNT